MKGYGYHGDLTTRIVMTSSGEPDAEWHGRCEVDVPPSGMGTNNGGWTGLTEWVPARSPAVLALVLQEKLAELHGSHSR